MDRARHAGIEGMHGAQNFDRAFGITHGIADERFFPPTSMRQRSFLNLLTLLFGCDTM